MKDIPDNNITRAQFNAYIGYNLSFGSYLGSYKRAFDTLMNSVYKSGLHVDHLAYPTLFMARHCMELGFKTNIRYFKKYSEKDDFTKAGTHDLKDLFNAFKLHIYETIKNLKEKYGSEVAKEDITDFFKICNEVDKLTNIFHLFDKNSDSIVNPKNQTGS